MDAQTDKEFSFYLPYTWFKEGHLYSIPSYVKNNVAIFLFLVEINSYYFDNGIMKAVCGKYAIYVAADGLFIAATMGFLFRLYITIVNYKFGQFQGNGQQLDFSSPALRLRMEELMLSFSQLICAIYDYYNKLLPISSARLILSSISIIMIVLKLCMKKVHSKKLHRHPKLGDFRHGLKILLRMLSSSTLSCQGSSLIRGRLSPSLCSCLPNSTDAILEMDLQLVRIACGRIARNEVSPETIDAVLQLCSTLTRNHSVAVCFLEADGLKSLFNSAISINFPRFYKIAAIIIYDILEDPRTLQQAMEFKINHILATDANGRLSPQNFLLKLVSVVSRDPKIFMQAAHSVCQVEMVGERPCIVSKLHEKAIFAYMKPIKSFIDTIYFLLDVINGFLPASIENAAPSDDSNSVSKENKTSREASALLSKVIFVMKILTKIISIYPSTIHVVLERDVGSTPGIVNHILHNRFLSHDLKMCWKHELAKQARQFLIVFCAHSIDARTLMLREISLILVTTTPGIIQAGIDVKAYAELIGDLQTYVDLINDVLATGSYILQEASIALFKSLLQILLVIGSSGSSALADAVIRAMEFVWKLLSTSIVSLSIHDSITADGIELFTTDYKELENPLSMDFSEVNLKDGLEKLDTSFQILRNSDDAQQSLAELLVYQLSLTVTTETSGRDYDGGRNKMETLQMMIKSFFEKQLHRDYMGRILLNLCADDETRIALLNTLMQKLNSSKILPANTAEPSFQSRYSDGDTLYMVETLNFLTENNPRVAKDLLQSLPILLGFFKSSDIAVLTKLLSLLESVINDVECKPLSTTVGSTIDATNDEHFTEGLVPNLQKEELQPLCFCLAVEGLSDDLCNLMVGVMKKLAALSPRHCHLFVAGLANSLETLSKSSIKKLSMFDEYGSELHGTSSCGPAILRVLQVLDYLLALKVEKKDQSEEHSVCLDHLCAINAMLNPLWLKLSRCLNKMKESYENSTDLLNLISSKPNLPSTSSQNILPYIESFAVMRNIGDCGAVDTSGGSEFYEKYITFDEFCEEHKQLFNLFIRQNVCLLEKSFSFMLEVPFFLDYGNKTAYLRSKLKHHQNPLRISVTRIHIFQNSYEELCMRSAEDLRGELIAEFKGEEVAMEWYQKVTREWYQLLKEVIFDKDLLLFTSVEKEKFQPLPCSDNLLKLRLPFFKFVGRFVGKALFDDQLLDVHFTRSFYKFMTRAEITDDDIKAMDPVYFEKLKGIHEVSEDQLKVIIDDRWNNSIKPIMSSFMEGFSELIPWELISIFSDRELELLIA